MVKVLNITISDVTVTLFFCLSYFFVRVLVRVYFDILSPVHLRLNADTLPSRKFASPSKVTTL